MPRAVKNTVAVTLVVALVVALVASAISTVAGAAAPAAGGVLRDPAGAVTWGGSFEDAAGVSAPEPYAASGSCATLTCSEFRLEVDRPAGVWDTGAGGVQIAVEGLATDQQLRQRIWSSDGSFTEVAVDTYEFLATHGLFLADQYIEISGVPDGTYVLETVSNPARTVAGR